MTTSTIAGKTRSMICKLHFREINIPVKMSALSLLFSSRKFSSILGGNPSVTNAGRFSYWAAEPKDMFEFRKEHKNPFEKLHKIVTKYKMSSVQQNLPKGIFTGGWIGYFSYELSGFIEQLPPSVSDDIETPLIRLCFYDSVIAYDHQEKTFLLFALEMPGDIKSPDQKIADLERLLLESQHIRVPDQAVIKSDDTLLSSIRCNMSRQYYQQAFKKIKRYIYDGDVYQINFSRRFEYPFNAAPVDLFNWQNHYNPSPYSAFIDVGDFQIVSASPEMFMTIFDGVISTKPIKGTRPRINNDVADTENYNELLASEKEQAELNMIIDLERNDIARICIPGTRNVTQPRAIESYPTLFHAVATIAGRLRNKVTFCDILKAMFPGGSITGAPKIRSMEIISELEPAARGIYTGSIGYIGLDGSVCLNIAIRTIIIKNKMAYVQTGGGIVADSDEQSEWNETIVKARALLDGIESVLRRE
jgi:para-aminobenzoate synthetase component I